MKTKLQAYQLDTTTLPRSTPLFHEPGLRGLLLHLKAGEELPEHSTPGTITVQCVRGEVVFASGEEQNTLTPGSLISLAAGAPHRASAQPDSLLLVTIREEIPNQAA
jgi:quercetin dioxygenase-like cupin family protein